MLVWDNLFDRRRDRLTVHAIDAESHAMYQNGVVHDKGKSKFVTPVAALHGLSRTIDHTHVLTGPCNGDTHAALLQSGGECADGFLAVASDLEDIKGSACGLGQHGAYTRLKRVDGAISEEIDNTETKVGKHPE
jgi:hypothetical protein